jgi:hypothetical protein
VATAQLPESAAALTVVATPVYSIFPSCVVCKYVSSPSDFVAILEIHNGHIQKFLFIDEMSSTIISGFLSSEPHSSRNLPADFGEFAGASLQHW